MEQTHCGHFGFLTDTVLACFDPEVILLLKSKFRLKAKIDFQDDSCGGHLGFSIGSFSSLMLIIKFQFNWIIEEMSKILKIFPI